MPRITVGLDLGDKYSSFCILSAGGEIVEEGRVRTRPEALREFLGRLDRARLAMETGTHSPWVSRLAEGCGHEVIVANSRKLQLISQNERKSDKADAALLARVARADPSLLKPVRHRSLAAQQALAALRARDALVGARTKLVNHVRGAVKSFGGRITKCSARVFDRKAQAYIPAEVRGALEPLLELIGQLTAKINKFDKEIEQTCQKRFPETERLRQVKGVGALTALGYVLVVDDPTRFEKSRTVGAYLGLVPKNRESGEKQPQLRISKAGDAFLRRLLVGSAQYILGPFGTDSDLRRYGEAIARRGGKNSKKRAAVAVARKLSVLLYRLWVNGERYEPLRNTARKGKRGRGQGRMVLSRSESR
jgi:transposase